MSYNQNAKTRKAETNNKTLHRGKIYKVEKLMKFLKELRLFGHTKKKKDVKWAKNYTFKILYIERLLGKQELKIWVGYMLSSSGTIDLGIPLGSVPDSTLLLVAINNLFCQLNDKIVLDRSLETWVCAQILKVVPISTKYFKL